MKYLLFLLLPLGAMGQVIKQDTVKCWVVAADSTNHLMLSKAWVIRKWQIYPIKYLAPNRRDSLAVIGDFKPIIQEWK